MTPSLNIRLESAADYAAIYALTEAAFRGRPYAGGDEQDVINRLRDRGELSLSLVATLGAVGAEQIVGQITFSPASVEDGSTPWFALGPVSVLPDHQGQGIGSALINRGLADIESQGALGCILTGNPDYYRRFGFEFANANVPAAEPAEYFMLKLFAAAAPSGTFAFKQAFYD